MNKNAKGVLVVLAVLGLAGISYGIYFYLKKDSVTKAQKIQYLVANNYTTGTPLQLGSFGDDYISAWYAAAKAMHPTFLLAAKTYNTNGGTAVSA